MSKIVFNDSTQIDVQQVVETAGHLKIKIIGLSREEILKIFQDPLKTQKIVVQEYRTSTVHERYTKFGSLTEFVGGIMEICMIQEGKDVSEIIDDLSEQITDLQVALCEVFEGLGV